MKLFVGNLAWSVTEDDLREFFEESGYPPETVQIVMNRETGKSRGFGFVTLEKTFDGGKAIGALNNQKLMGRAVTVNEARPMEKSVGRTSARR